MKSSNTAPNKAVKNNEENAMTNPVGRVRELREARGMSLEDVAKLIEPRPAKMTLSRLERGERKMTTDWATKIASALNVTVEELLEGEVVSHISPEWLTAELTRRSITRRSLAELLSIPASSVTDMLNGRRNISIDEARRINTWLNQTVPEPTTRPTRIPLYRMIEEAGLFRRSDKIGDLVPLDGFSGFAIAFSGFDASPRYEEGDVLLIDTTRPVRRGDYVYITKETGLACVRRLNKRDADGFHLQTIAQGANETIRASDIKHIYVIRGSIVT